MIGVGSAGAVAPALPLSGGATPSTQDDVAARRIPMNAKPALFIREIYHPTLTIPIRVTPSRWAAAITCATAPYFAYRLTSM